MDCDWCDDGNRIWRRRKYFARSGKQKVSIGILHTSRERTAGNPIAGLDSWLIGATGALLILGILVVYSASVSLAEKSTGNSMYFLIRQLAHVTLGVGVMWIVAQSRVRIDRKSVV